MMAVELKNISKHFGSTEVLQNVNLSVPEGELLVLVGPSGCGKSTLLRMIAGLETPDQGQIFLNGQNVARVEPQDRNLAIVFQSYALYPHMTVFENMSFGLKLRSVPKTQIQKQVSEIAELLQLSSFLNRKPKELSGGQRQRVALGRALVRKSPLILFDEPLSNLDAHLRQQTRIEIKKIHQHLKNTMIYVTHDQVEATTLGNRMVVMNKGRIEQIDTPHNIYHRPSSLFVARFIGSPEINLFQGHFQDHKWVHQKGFVVEATPTASENIFLGIRPEHVRLTAPTHQLRSGKVEFIENLGSHSLVHLDSTLGELKALVSQDIEPEVGSHVGFDFDSDKIHWLEGSV